LRGEELDDEKKNEEEKEGDKHILILCYVLHLVIEGGRA